MKITNVNTNYKTNFGLKLQISDEAIKFLRKKGVSIKDIKSLRTFAQDLTPTDYSVNLSQDKNSVFLDSEKASAFDFLSLVLPEQLYTYATKHKILQPYNIHTYSEPKHQTIAFLKQELKLISDAISEAKRDKAGNLITKNRNVDAITSHYWNA